MKKFWLYGTRHIAALALVFALAFAIWPDTCSAGTISTIAGIDSEMPWKTGFQKLATEMSGPLPKFLGVIAIGAAFGMLIFGEMGPAAKKAIAIVVGVAGMLGAVTLMNLIGEGTDGATFIVESQNILLLLGGLLYG